MKPNQFCFALVLLLSFEALGTSASAEELFKELNSNKFNTMRSEALRDIQLLPEVKALLRRPGHELKTGRAEFSAGIRSHLFRHFYQGLEVLGSMVGHHVGPTGKQFSDSAPQFDLDVRPAFSAAEAVSIARAMAGDRALVREPVLKVLPVDDESNAAHLVYWISLKGKNGLPGRDVIINAHTRSVLANMPRRISIAPIDPADLTPIEVFQASDKCQELEEMWEGSGQFFPKNLDYLKCDRAFGNSEPMDNPDPEAIQAFRNSQQMLAYYRAVHDRDSYDGAGSRVASVVHGGKNMLNAFWDIEDKIMVYGDGDGKTTQSLVYSVDVAGHEMTHGVVAHTAALIYKGESGALNEAYADLFGEAIEGFRINKALKGTNTAADVPLTDLLGESDWIMGANVYKKVADAPAGFRNLQDPLAINFYEEKNTEGKLVRYIPYPTSMEKRAKFPEDTICGDDNDLCGVHLNSTVFSHWGYLVSQAIGAEKAQKLWYATLTHYLTKTSGFMTAARKTKQACEMLYGVDSDTCASVKSTFREVGL